MKKCFSRPQQIDLWRDVTRHLKETRRRDGHRRVGYEKQDALRVVKLILDRKSFRKHRRGEQLDVHKSPE